MSQRVLAIEQIMTPNHNVHPDIKAAIDNHNRGAIKGLDKFFEIVPALEEIARAEGENK